MNNNYSRKKSFSSGSFPTAAEIDGLVDLGMKREALKAARHQLKNPSGSADTFNSAVNAILTLSDKLPPWKPLVEKASQRLGKRESRAARFFILSFRWACHDYSGVLRMSPEQTGEFELLELAYFAEAALALNKKAIVTRLARKITRAIRYADNPMMRASLALALSECHIRAGRWMEAIEVAKIALSCETLSQNAVVQIVEIHVARALLTLHTGLQYVQQFQRHLDPATETMLPGNDDLVQEKAAREYRRQQKSLKRILCEERLRQLGIHEC